MRLTDISVKALPAPERGQKTYRDNNMAGFAVRVSQGGTKTFVLIHGADRQFTTLGRYPVISLAEARVAARHILAERTLNKHRPTRIAFADALDLFVAEKQQKNRARTIMENQRLLTKYFPALQRKNLEDIRADDITRQLDKLIPTPGTALHAFWAMRTFLRWCFKRNYLDHNPIERLDPPSRMVFRERVLTDDELCAVWKAADGLGGRFGAIVKLLILTGQRRSEIGSLQTDYLKTNEICLPSEITKNRRSHTFPIATRAATIAADNVGNDAYLFRSDTSDEKPFSGWSKAKAQLDQKANIASWTLHDLRRTFATGLQRLGVRIEVIEALLNHVSGTRSGIVGVYQRHNYAREMREAVELWENHLQAILNKA